MTALSGGAGHKGQVSAGVWVAIDAPRKMISRILCKVDRRG